MNRRMNAAQTAAAPPPAAAAPPPPPAAAAPPAPNGEQPPAYLAELEQLSALHASGILSDEEFAAKKRQILAL